MEKGEDVRLVAVAQLEVPAMVLLTLEKVALALVPSAVMATMHTTMIRASMTAYSTAVGPSSRFRKFTTQRLRFESIRTSPFNWGNNLGLARTTSQAGS